MSSAAKPWIWTVVIVVAAFAAVSGVLILANSPTGPFAPGPPGGPWFDPRYAVSGLVVGVMIGMTGLGGGALMTPILVLLFGFHPGTAVGTDLLQASATKTVGTGVHAFNRCIAWKVVGLMATGSIPATAATLAGMYALGMRGDTGGRVIEILLGVMLILTAAALVFRKPILDFATRRWGEPDPRTRAWLTVGLGAALGVLITLSSVGAGALGVTILTFLHPRLPTAKVVGSDIAHAVPLTLMAGLGHWWLGSVNLALLASLLVGSIPGVIIGGAVTSRIPDPVLRPIMATTLAIVGARMTA